MATPADAFDFFAAVQAPMRMQPGLRRLAPGVPQLHANRRGSRHLQEKLRALAPPVPPGLQCAAGFDATPGLHALAAHAAAEHPQAFAWDGDTARARWLGWSVRAGDLLMRLDDTSIRDQLASAEESVRALTQAFELPVPWTDAWGKSYATTTARPLAMPSRIARATLSGL